VIHDESYPRFVSITFSLITFKFRLFQIFQLGGRPTSFVS